MSGRRSAPRRRAGRSRKTRAAGILTDYLLTSPKVDFQSLASGGELKLVLLDNSSDFGNVPVRVVKMKAQSFWARNVIDERHLSQAVYRDL